MKSITCTSLIFLIVAFVAQIAWAGGGTVHVRSYYRSNGTYVHAYNRAGPGTAVSVAPLSTPNTSVPRVVTPSVTVPSVFGQPGAAPTLSIPRAIPRAIPVATTASSTKTTHSFYNSSSARFSSSLGVQRDTHERIQRSEPAKHEFMQMIGYPHGRPGYVVDHIVPLKRGGCDCHLNMQWQTIQEAKAKDKWE
jgi:hypothetical protein